MQAIRKFFCQFDMFSAPAVLRIKQEPEMKSLAAGIVSFALACFFAYVFINSSIDVINFTQITSSQSDSLIKNKDAIGSFSMFAISLDFMDITDFREIFQFSTQVYMGNTLLRSIPMIQCQPDQWKALGDTYQQDFIDYELGTMLCPNTTDEFQLKETSRSRTPIYVWVSMSACTNLTYASCDITAATSYLNAVSSDPGDGAAIISIYVLDKAVAPDSKDPVEYFINIDAKTQVTNKFGGVAIIEFSTFQVDTDVSIWPVEQIETVNGVGIGQVRNYQAGFVDMQADILARITFTMNQQKATITRVVGKVDELLSYAGGLFSIVIGFLAFFLISFNEYRYELTVAEGVFDYDESGRRVTESYLNFLRYIKYTIFDWVQVICCCQLNWQDCKDINQTRQQIIAQMQVHRIFKRIHNLQTAINPTIDENQRICMNLVSQPTLQKLKNDRMVIDYYGAFVDGKEPPVLVEDVKIIGGQLVIAQDKAGSQSNFGVAKVGDSFNSFGDNSFLTIEKDRKQENRGNILQKIAESFPQIKKQAEEFKLPEDLEQVENKIAQAFFKLSSQKRATIQEKMPVIIVHRLYMKMSKDRGVEMVEEFKQ